MRLRTVSLRNDPIRRCADVVRLLLALAMLALAGPVAAQEAVPDPVLEDGGGPLDQGTLERGAGSTATPFDADTAYPEWERLATRAEGVIEDGRASTEAFEALRADLARWRATFQQAQSANSSRIETLKAQITALGPVPDKADGEPADLTARRDQLTRQLARLEAPRRAADEAWSRADALIREIDALIRDRQADALLQLGPSPLNLRHWPGAFAELAKTVRAAGNEVVASWNNVTRMAEARNRIPLTVLMFVLALVLLLRVPGWLFRLERRLVLGRSDQLSGVIEFLLSLLRAGAIFLGIAAIQAGIDFGNLAGHRGQVLTGQLALLGLLMALSIWVGSHIFPRGEEGNKVLRLPRERRRQGRALVLVLGAMLWLIVLVREMSRFEGYSDATRAVIQFPVLVAAGLCLAELGRLIGYRPAPTEGEAVGGEFRRSLARNTGRVVALLGILGPILAAIGYQSAASFLTFPAAQSLALLATLVLLQRFATDIYGLLTGKTDADLHDELVPVLIGMALGVLSLPLFALIWGARVADLTEIWTRILGGFMLGDTRISPAMFLTFVLVFAIGYGVTRLVQGTLRTAVLPKTRIDQGARNAIVSGIGYLGILLATLLAVTSTGISLTSLAFVAGALSVGIGFGLQNIVSNFVSGIIMLIERPVAEGDWIEVGGRQGIVKAISVRSTRIETFDRNSVIVPNADFISSPVTNWTRNSLTGRIVVSVGVAYGSDTRKVAAILLEIVEAHPLVTLNPAPSVSFEDFGADALQFVIRALLRDINFGLAVRSELRHQIATRFAAEGIEIPFGQRDIWLRNPEKLAGAFTPKAGASGVQGQPAPETAAQAAPAEPAPAAPGPADPAPVTGERTPKRKRPAAAAKAAVPDAGQNPAEGHGYGPIDEDD
jgi:small-conductance mechanosensitive channel